MSLLRKFTLGQVLLVSLFTVSLLMAFAYSIAMRSSYEALLFASAKLQDEVSEDISRKMEAYFGSAETAIDTFDAAIAAKAVNKHPENLRTALYSIMLQNSNLSELSFTGAEISGRDQDGFLTPKSHGKFQIHLYRNSAEIEEEYVQEKNGQFTKIKNNKIAVATDPTEEKTFKTPSREDFIGEKLWSDLHWINNKSKLVVTVQKAIYNSKKEFWGVLRAGLDYSLIEKITAQKILSATSASPGYIFLIDTHKHFIAGFPGENHFEEIEGDLSLQIKNPPLEIKNVLAQEELSDFKDTKKGTASVSGKAVNFLFRKIPNSRDWIIGSIVKTDEVLRPVTRSRDFGRLVSILLFLLSGGIGILVLRNLKRYLEKIIEESNALKQFHFDGKIPEAPFRDLYALSESFERTKNALRTMSKYASVDLVRDLFLSQQEARLGAESKILTILFSDIQDFTTITERVAPNDLANHLGTYFEEMIDIIQKKHHGTVDKFIGDSLMVFWNSPHSISNHAQHACEAALQCRKLSRTLPDKASWGSFPTFSTRFGIHTDTVLVGHFGAPERMNYGALGDGVNLASRLESLNKFFGTSILVSDAVKSLSPSHLFFREIAEVSVKGREHSNTIFELVDLEENLTSKEKELLLQYGDALQLYREQKFARSMQILEGNREDPPSRWLYSLCEKLSCNAPDSHWSPILKFNEK